MSPEVVERCACFDSNASAQPFAVYFADAVGAVIYALPYSQFCIQKDEPGHIEFVDLTKTYDDVTLRNQLRPEEILKLILRERYPPLTRSVIELEAYS